MHNEKKFCALHGKDIYLIILTYALITITLCHAWLPDTSSKIMNAIGNVTTVKFIGNSTFPDHFTILNQDDTSILLGGRNTVYNLSVFDFTERRESRFEWPSTVPHEQLCILKGKTEDDCQNYIRILVNTEPDKMLICGTNSYKPLCRHYSMKNGVYVKDKELEGMGICPYDPEHNSTAIYYNDQLFSATVADFSSGDPLIYRGPQRTERSDLRQLNDPNFVSSVPYGDYVFFFYRETAVEYINCGKVIYSRVARVCKNDKGGPHQFGDRWTSFLKARLNCSMPGEYPFYFDEIQATTDIIEGYYGTNVSEQIIYGTLTTPINAIGGSAVCAYKMGDILRVFEGTFKQQENINSNWLPLVKDKIPEPRPGQCVQDSRILPENSVNFVKTHSLMESAVPAFFGKPLLIRVNIKGSRFTAITVQPQVESVDDGLFDVLYIGTDDGKVLKVVNIATASSVKTVVISENVILPNGSPVKQLKIAPGYGRVIVVGRDEARLANLNHCATKTRCADCVALQDPHCAWDMKKEICASLDAVSTVKRSLMQDVIRGDGRKCLSSGKKNQNEYNNNLENKINADLEDHNEIPDQFLKGAGNGIDCNNNVESNEINGCAVQQKLVIYTAETLHLFVIGACFIGLLLGFIAGFLFSRKFHPSSHQGVPFIEQRNRLDRMSANQSGFLTPRPNKDVNLVINVPPNPPPPKKDNLDVSKDMNIASDGTLQKIKKTYI